MREITKHDYIKKNVSHTDDLTLLVCMLVGLNGLNGRIVSHPNDILDILIIQRTLYLSTA